MTQAAPYLSVVATSRNDDHGGTLLRRMQIFVDGLIAQCRRHHLAAELILVEWNPPANRPRLAQALRWPLDTGPCQVRVIEVPESIHRRFRHSRNLPLFQMIAKNVGIRRARGQFILATNIDILFSDELMAFIAAGKLERNRLYRIDRHDVMADVPHSADMDQQLDWCRTHLIRVNAREGTFRLTPTGEYELSSPDIASACQGIRFGPGWYAPESSCGEPFRWAADPAVLIVQNDGQLPRTIALEIEPGPGVGQQPFCLEVRDERGGLIARGTIEKRQRVTFRLLAEKAAVERLFLRTPEGGGPTLNDWRILNFRVFDCQRVENWHDEKSGDEDDTNFRVSASRPGPRGVVEANDLVSVDDGLQFGPGWHPVEEWNGSRFRWAANDAVLVVSPTAAAESLTLAVEPGPGVGYRPFDLQLLDEDGKPLQRTSVTGASLATFQINHKAGRAQAFTLRANGGGLPASNDSRILNFRVFHPITLGRPTLGLRARLLARKAVRSLAGWLPGLKAMVSRWRSRRRFGKPLPPLAEMPAASGEAVVSPVPLHLNASGDFTMLAREHWFDLRGHPEFEMYSLHIDSVFCYMAHHAGCREAVLPDPMRIYHIEHSTGSGWTPEGEGVLMARLRQQGIPVLSAGEILHWATQMRRQNGPIIFNRETWGLGDVDLPEQTLASEAMPCAYR